MTENLTDNEIELIERQVAQQLDKMELKSGKEKINELRDRLDMTQKPTANKAKRNRFFTGILSAAASVILLVGIGLTVYFMQSTPPPAGEYIYTDEYILAAASTQDEFPNIYMPNFDELSEKNFTVGEHKLSREVVYYKVSGKYGASSAEFLFIINPKYMSDDEDYNTDDTVDVAGKTISYKAIPLENSSFLYKLGFKIDDSRYYMDLTTPEYDGGEQSLPDDNLPEYLYFLEAFIK